MFMSIDEKRKLIAAGKGDSLPRWEGPLYHTLDSYHNQLAANVIQLANSGEATLEEALTEFCDDQSETHTRAFIRSRIVKL